MSLERAKCGTPSRPEEGGGASFAPLAPEQISVAVEPITITIGGITYRTERTILAAKRISTAQTSPPPEPAEFGPGDLSLAAKVFQLLTALDPDNRLRKAPPIKVFNLCYREGLGPAGIARRCHCHRSLIYDRLATMQKKLPWTPQQLWEVSPQVEAMEDAVRESRAKSIYRKGAVYGGEDDDRKSD